MIGMALQKMQSLRSRGFPTSSKFEITTHCNLACDYCFIEPCSDELTTSQVCAALDRLSNEGIPSIVITGGEPFLRSDILDILGYIVKKKFFDMVILSNGTAIKPDHIRFLHQHAGFIGYIRFSFFSHHATVHDAFTGVTGSFAAALAAADALYAGNVKVTVIINLTETNIDTIGETRSFFLGRGFDVQIGSMKINATERIRTEYAPTTTAAFYRKYLSTTVKDGVAVMRSTFEKNIRSDPYHGYLCENLFGTISILANGDIVPCLSFRHHPIGNITTDQRPLHEILWTSDLYRELRHLKRTDLEKCSTCQFIRFCILCPGVMFSENGTWRVPMQQTCNYARAYYETLYE